MAQHRVGPAGLEPGGGGRGVADGRRDLLEGGGPHGGTRRWRRQWPRGHPRRRPPIRSRRCRPPALPPRWRCAPSGAPSSDGPIHRREAKACSVSSPARATSCRKVSSSGAPRPSASRISSWSCCSSHTRSSTTNPLMAGFSSWLLAVTSTIRVPPLFTRMRYSVGSRTPGVVEGVHDRVEHHRVPLDVDVVEDVGAHQLVRAVAEQPLRGLVHPRQLAEGIDHCGGHRQVIEDGDAVDARVCARGLGSGHHHIVPFGTTATPQQVGAEMLTGTGISGAGPTLPPPTSVSLPRGRSSVGRAPALQAGGRGFESHRLHECGVATTALSGDRGRGPVTGRSVTESCSNWAGFLIGRQMGCAWKSADERGRRLTSAQREVHSKEHGFCACHHRPPTLYDLTRERVEAAMRGVAPESIQAHFVIVSGRRYPPKSR